ncbi:MAG TPA: uroporphyrinogen decarboxylase family protein [Candidatus Hydrogenedentes bacterium]|jgi:uroporphyrinogen decarboxylase|nr:uroporphyrinogen decarboxylase family protein [Candidatus Hydrogenedentota bacterium]
MTQEQWHTLLAVVDGTHAGPPPAGFIIDSPWLPNWAGMSILDYLSSESRWFEANLQAVERFPDALFLPGFWAEYGMCTEPSAFGAKCIFPDNEFPFAERACESIEQAATLPKPDPRTDGLAPFVLKRLQHLEPRIVNAGHAIRFAVARGPLNIAGFLLGNTELLLALKMDPDASHSLLNTLTSYLEDWLKLQAAAFPSIDGVLMLDDLVGFLGPDDFQEFAQPYLKRAFEAIDARVRFFHNDAEGLICAPFLAGTGINLFNFSHNHPLQAMREAAGEQVALLGNIPPRDVLAQGTPDQVRQSVRELLESITDTRGLILSCGGGMPPGVPAENIDAFLEAAADG